MKKVIITGVTGQDGSLLADYLLRETDNLIIGGVRRLSVKNHDNIKHLKNEPRFKLIDLDITDSQNTSDVIREERPDYFVNFAANSFVGNSWTMPVNHMETNAMAVLYQLEAIRKYAPHCRYYNAGSSEEFGDVVTTPQDESHPLRPRSPYGASKCSARHLVKVYRDSYKLYAVQGWLFNHEGLRRGEEFVTRKITKNVARILKEDREGKKTITPLELGNMDAKRDWSDAEDFVRGVWMMLNQQETILQKALNEEKAGHYDFNFIPKDYVLSSNETHTVKEFVECAFAAAGYGQEKLRWVGEGVDTKFLYGDNVFVTVNPEFYRPAEVDLLLGDSTLIREELGWKPEFLFHDLVGRMVRADISV